MNKLLITLLGIAGMFYLSNSNVNAQLIPSKFYTPEETDSLIRKYNKEILGGEYNQENICIENLTLGYKRYNVVLNESRITFFSLGPSDKKARKEAKKNKEFDEWPVMKQRHSAFTAVLESKLNKNRELEVRKNLEAQVITNK